MKKILSILFFLIAVIHYSNGQQVTYEYVLASKNDESINALLEDNNQSIYVTGSCGKPDSRKHSGLVFKLNKNGLFVDSIHIAYSDNSLIIENILHDTTNSLILSGIKTDTIDSKHYAINLFKIDTSFNILHQEQYNLPDDYKLSVQVTRFGENNNILVIGTVKIPFSKMFFYKFNKNLDSLSAKIYLNNPSIYPYEIKELNNGNYWILRGLYSYYALIDSNLNMISPQQGVIPNYLNSSYGLKWDSDSSFYLAADFAIIPSKNRTNLLVSSISTEQISTSGRQTDHDIGLLKQYHPFDTTGYIFNSVGVVDTFDFPAAWGALDYKNKDSIFIGGTKNVSWSNALYGQQPAWYHLVQTDSMLNVRWEHFYYGDAYYFMSKLIATSDGGCIMAGTRFDYKTHPWVHERDIYILKVNAEGLITSTNGKSAPIVHDAIVYPNPGSNVLRVRVAAQHPESLFKLYNMSGKLVLQLPIHGKTAAFNTTFLPPATYIYTITAKTGLNEKGKWVKE